MWDYDVLVVFFFLSVELGSYFLFLLLVLFLGSSICYRDSGWEGVGVISVGVG